MKEDLHLDKIHLYEFEKIGFNENTNKRHCFYVVETTLFWSTEQKANLGIRILINL
ncbi:MAG: hypothetical protein WA959_27620 [Rivularia sp. (in: cyanobacteria)]